MPNLSCGIVGLPNVGKSTLFNALTNLSAEASNFPFCTIDPNIGVVEVKDARLQVLAKIVHSKKIIPASILITDIAGLIQGASAGKGGGYQFLQHIQNTNILMQVVRCFDDDQIVHVDGKIDPIADIDTIQIELLSVDLKTIHQILTKRGKKHRTIQQELSFLTLEKIQLALNELTPVRHVSLSAEEEKSIQEFFFLTKKPILYCANISQNDLPQMDNKYVAQVQNYAKMYQEPCIAMCIKLEEEITRLPSKEEQEEYLHSFGLRERPIHALIHKAFQTLGLITFFTAGEKEVKAWTISKGATAIEAAGKIHSDIQKGFIRAEVISYHDFCLYKGRTGSKEAGKSRMEGKHYVVKSDDVILFHHH